MMKNFIERKGNPAIKRKSFPFPQANIHSKPIIHVENEFFIYEHYGTWFLKIL